MRSCSVDMPTDTNCQRIEKISVCVVLIQCPMRHAPDSMKPHVIAFQYVVDFSASFDTITALQSDVPV